MGNTLIFSFCGHTFTVCLYENANEAKAIIASYNISHKVSNVTKRFEEFDSYAKSHSIQPFVLDDSLHHHRVLIDCSDYGYCNSTHLFIEFLKRHVGSEEYIKYCRPKPEYGDEFLLIDAKLHEDYGVQLGNLSSRIFAAVNEFIENRKG